MPNQADVKPSEAVTPARAQPQSIAGWLRSPQLQEQIARALPSASMRPEKFLRIVYTEFNRDLGRAPDKQLRNCHIDSFMGSVLTCAQLGLEPGGPLGHAYLLPFKNNRMQRLECQLILGYKGMITLARRSGAVLKVEAHGVREKDKFEFQYGTNEYLTHIPASGNRGELKYAWAMANIRDGLPIFTVLGKEDVERRRQRSRAKDSGPWVTDREAMWQKSAVRALMSFLPLSTEASEAIERDDRIELGIGELDELAGTVSSGLAEDPTPIAWTPAQTEEFEAMLEALPEKPQAASVAAMRDEVHETAMAALNEWAKRHQPAQDPQAPSDEKKSE